MRDELKEIIRDLILDINFDVRVWETKPDDLLERYTEDTLIKIENAR